MTIPDDTKEFPEIKDPPKAELRTMIPPGAPPSGTEAEEPKESKERALEPPAGARAASTEPAEGQPVTGETCRFCGGPIPKFTAQFCSKQGPGITCRP